MYTARANDFGFRGVLIFSEEIGATVGGYTLLKPLPSDLGSTYLGIRMSREYHLGVYTSQATDSGSRGSETRNQTYEWS